MTTFLDGPAKGKTLMLKRAPIFLRSTLSCLGEVDALDQIDDSPKSNESLTAYALTAAPGMVHIYMGRKGGGWYPIAQYRAVDPQPFDVEMRTNGAWQKWCRDHRNLSPVLERTP